MSQEASEKLFYLRGDTPRKEVALAVGISVSALSNYEHGIRVPKDNIKKRLADYYGKTVGEIFFAEESHAT